MDKDHLKIFYDQEPVRNAVKDYFLLTLDQQVLERAYKEGDVTGYKEARMVITSAFSKLNELYAKSKNSNKENNAR